MLIFGLCSTSDDQPGWSVDSNPIYHPSPAKNMKCLFLDYIQLLMISQAGGCTWTPFATSLQPKNWNAHFWITFNSWWSPGLVNGLEPHLPPLSSQKNEMLIFGLRSTPDDWPGWSMDLNPICHPSPAKKMICLFLDYIQLLMISWAGWWTRTPSASPLQPKKLNVHFKIMFNFWRLAGLIDGLKQHLQLLCSQKNEMLIFGFHLTSDDWKGWSMDSNPICHPSPATKMKCSFLGYVQLLMISQAGQWTQTPSTTPLQPKTWNACFWITFNFSWSARLVNGLESHLTPISSQKIEMLIFGLHSTPDNCLGWSMDLNPIYHLSPAKNMKCSFLDYIQLLMIGWAGRWNWALCATSLQPKKWNVHFWITFNFWWLVRLVDGLEPHPPPISSQENEMFIFGLCSTSDDQPGWSMDSNPICHLSPAKNMKCSFLDYIQLLMISRAGQWTRTPSATHIQPKKMKCSFLDYIQLLMISWIGQWTRMPSTTPLQPKTWNACFWITFNFWWLARLIDGLKPHLPPLSSQKKWNPHFWNTFNSWWSARLVDGLEPHLPPLSSHKNEMLIFRLHSTSDDWPGWSMDSNPICHPSPAKNMKC